MNTLKRYIWIFVENYAVSHKWFHWAIISPEYRIGLGRLKGALWSWLTDKPYNARKHYRSKSLIEIWIRYFKCLFSRFLMNNLKKKK